MSVDIDMSTSSNDIGSNDIDNRASSNEIDALQGEIQFYTNATHKHQQQQQRQGEGDGDGEAAAGKNDMSVENGVSESSQHIDADGDTDRQQANGALSKSVF